MKNLLIKEFRLAMHPTSVIFLGMAAMMMIPNYPLSVTFFYSCLGVMFVSQNSRENKDILYTTLLPVRKSDLVRARLGMIVILQLAQILLCVPFLFLRQLYEPANLVGMDANLALLGFGLMMMGLFNLIFFPRYFRDPSKVGVPFLIACIAVILMVFVSEATPHFVPLIRDKLDTPLFQFVPEKFLCFGICALAYGCMTFLARNISIRRFEQYDLT